MHPNKTAAAVDIVATVIVVATFVVVPMIKKHRANKKFANTWTDVPGVTNPNTY